MTGLISTIIILAVGCFAGVCLWMLDRRTIRDLDEELARIKLQNTNLMLPIRVCEKKYPIETFSILRTVPIEAVIDTDGDIETMILKSIANDLGAEVLKRAEITITRNLPLYFDYVIEAKVRMVNMSQDNPKHLFKEAE